MINKATEDNNAQPPATMKATKAYIKKHIKDTTKMNQINLKLTTQQILQLDALADNRGLNRSTLIRHIAIGLIQLK